MRERGSRFNTQPVPPAPSTPEQIAAEENERLAKQDAEILDLPNTNLPLFKHLLNTNAKFRRDFDEAVKRRGLPPADKPMRWVVD